MYFHAASKHGKKTLKFDFLLNFKNFDLSCALDMEKVKLGGLL